MKSEMAKILDRAVDNIEDRPLVVIGLGPQGTFYIRHDPHLNAEEQGTIIDALRNLLELLTK